MIVDRTIVLAAPADEAFERVLDIPFVGACLPGASDVVPDEDGSYRGRFAVRIGPVSVKLDGTVRVVEVDQAERRAVLRMDGADRGIGGNVAGDMNIRVLERTASESELVVHTEVTISGRIGQFGQAVILRKADQITGAFIDKFSLQLADYRRFAAQSGVATPPAAVGAPTPAPVLAQAGAAAAAPVTVLSPPGGSPNGAARGTTAGSRVHTVGALFRRGRTVAMITDASQVQHAARVTDLGAIWLGDGFPVSNALSTAVPCVFAVPAGSVAELAARLDAQGPGIAAAAAVAVLPRGDTIGVPEQLDALARTAAGTTGLPVVLVAETPWAALLSARVAAGGAAHGLAVQLAGADTEPALTSLAELAVREIRLAGLELPVLAGPVTPDAGRRLREAGADGVFVRTSVLSRRRLRRH